MTRNNMETKGFISYNPRDILITEGTQGRHLETGTEAEAVKDCCLLVCSRQPASYATQTTHCGAAPPLSPPMSIKTVSYRVLMGIWMEASSQLTWTRVKSTESYSHTRRQRQEGLPKFKASQRLLSKSLSQNKQTKAKNVIADKCNVWILIDHCLKKKWLKPVAPQTWDKWTEVSINILKQMLASRVSLHPSVSTCYRSLLTSMPIPGLPSCQLLWPLYNNHSDLASLLSQATPLGSSPLPLLFKWHSSVS